MLLPVDDHQTRSSAIHASSGNTIAGTGNSHTIGGGYANVVNGAFGSTVSGGENNEATGTRSTVIGGQSNTATADMAVALGGYNNDAEAIASTASGLGSRARIYGQQAHSSGNWDVAGDTQMSDYAASAWTDNATPTDIEPNFGTGSISVLPDGAWMVEALVVARREATQPAEAKGWRLFFCVAANTGSAALVGSVDSTSWGAPTWTVAVTVSSAGVVKLTATGEAAKTIHWHASIRTSEVLG